MAHEQEEAADAKVTTQTLSCADAPRGETIAELKISLMITNILLFIKLTQAFHKLSLPIS